MLILNTWLWEYVHSLLNPKLLGHLERNASILSMTHQCIASSLGWADGGVFLGPPWKRQVADRMCPGPRMLSLRCSLQGITWSALSNSDPSSNGVSMKTNLGRCLSLSEASRPYQILLRCESAVSPQTLRC